MKKILFLLMAALGCTGVVYAQTAVRTKHFNLEKGIAIQGYDPVAYFIQNKAVKGDKQWAIYAEGATYYFSSAANKALFLADPKHYEPQYGGWCAYAMGASNEKVAVDPGTFKVLNGKLYLFYHSWLNNTLNKWNKNEANLKAKADINWLSIFK